MGIAGNFHQPIGGGGDGGSGGGGGGTVTGTISTGAPTVYYNVDGGGGWTETPPTDGAEYALTINGTSIGRYVCRSVRTGSSGEWSYRDDWWAEIEFDDLDGVNHSAFIQPLIGTSVTLAWS